MQFQSVPSSGKMEGKGVERWGQRHLLLILMERLFLQIRFHSQAWKNKCSAKSHILLYLEFIDAIINEIFDYMEVKKMVAFLRLRNI